MADYERKNQFRGPLFEFYINRAYNPVEDLQGINRILGVVAVGATLVMGGYVGVGLAVISGATAIVNEGRLSKILDKVSNEHQSIIRSVYESQE